MLRPSENPVPAIRYAVSATRPLFGFHAVTARVRQRAESVDAIYVDAARHDARMRELTNRAKATGIAVHAVDAARLDALAGHAPHQGVVAIVDANMPHVTLDDVLSDLVEPALLLVLDGVTDPHNLGACLRSADAFGAHAVVVPKDRSVGVNATVAKSASGAADTVPVITVTNLARTMRALKDRGVWLLGADVGGESLFDADVSGPVAWVLGAEGQGLRRLTRESCDRLIAIPMLGSVASLNVSVTAGICLYSARQARARSS
ncbi:MAG TPA: 23S rRNA (guanosine(2251)-2'-O)-methyltransferase RlmB [Casimicrobiaceae bacterium]|jgi:23S rRNA (guanosine2251-2'-O)-methyltransferase|nr:23S rRNA (guanosine(2251)-2'-O)-methyltransferase RlmB [Casimicrobiaceae bacterium]